MYSSNRIKLEHLNVLLRYIIVISFESNEVGFLSIVNGKNSSASTELVFEMRHFKIQSLQAEVECEAMRGLPSWQLFFDGYKATV